MSYTDDKYRKLRTIYISKLSGIPMYHEKNCAATKKVKHCLRSEFLENNARTVFPDVYLLVCPKLVSSDHSTTSSSFYVVSTMYYVRTQLAYDFLLHRRKLMMSIYHELRALYNFHSRLRLLNTHSVELCWELKANLFEYSII